MTPHSRAVVILFVCVSFTFTHGGILEATGKNFHDTFSQHDPDLWEKDSKKFQCLLDSCVVSNDRNVYYTTLHPKHGKQSNELQLWLRRNCHDCCVKREIETVCTKYTTGSITSVHSYSYGSFLFIARVLHNVGGCSEVQKNRALVGYDLVSGGLSGRVVGSFWNAVGCMRACIQTPGCKGYTFFKKEAPGVDNCALKFGWDQTALKFDKCCESQEISDICRLTSSNNTYNSPACIQLRGESPGAQKMIIMGIFMCFPKHQNMVSVMLQYGSDIYTKRFVMDYDTSRTPIIYRIDWHPEKIAWVVNDVIIDEVQSPRYMIPDTGLHIKAFHLPQNDDYALSHPFKSVFRLQEMMYMKYQVDLEHVELFQRNHKSSSWFFETNMILLVGFVIIGIIYVVIKIACVHRIDNGYKLMQG